jgi:hypothetical protein
MSELIWERHSDPFWGQCILIRGLSYDREKKDYVALYMGADDPKYEFTRRWLKHKHGQCLIPCDAYVNPKAYCGVCLDGAIIEARVDGDIHIRQIINGDLVEIARENIRPALAAWLFATGQSLHP